MCIDWSINVAESSVWQADEREGEHCCLRKRLIVRYIQQSSKWYTTPEIQYINPDSMRSVNIRSTLVVLPFVLRLTLIVVR